MAQVGGAVMNRRLERFEVRELDSRVSRTRVTLPIPTGVCGGSVLSVRNLEGEKI